MIAGAVPPEAMVSVALPLPPEASEAALVTSPDVLTTATGATFGVDGPSTYCCQSGFVGHGEESAFVGRDTDAESAEACDPGLSMAAASAATARTASLAIRP